MMGCYSQYQVKTKRVGQACTFCSVSIISTDSLKIGDLTFIRLRGIATAERALRVYVLTGTDDHILSLRL